MTLSHTLLIIFGLGLYHGINPAMGWLLATSLGFQRKSTKALFVALVVLRNHAKITCTFLISQHLHLLRCKSLKTKKLAADLRLAAEAL